jgi:hypothetical protein
MNMILRLVAALLMIAGCLWTLQGLSLIGGSFMVGQTSWLIIGLCTMVAGAFLLFFLRRQ